MNKELVSKYFTRVENSYIFTGNKLIVKIPARYEMYNFLTYGDTITSLGIFEMEIDNSIKSGCLLPAVIHMEPSYIYNEKDENNKELVIGEFQKDDIFISNTIVLKQERIAYDIFVEFIKNGHRPNFLSYDQMFSLFDNINSITGFKGNINHAIYEIIYAHLFRDPDDLKIKYRYTDMSKKPVFIGLSNIVYGTDSTTTKLVGSYFSDGLNAALVEPNDQNQDMEDLLRL